MASQRKEFETFLNVPLSTALFTVDSRDGLNVYTKGAQFGTDASGFIIDPQNPYDINIYKNQQLFSGAVQRIALTEINMPWDIPNVNPYNNVLYIEWTFGDTEDFYQQYITIPTGFYTPLELKSALETALNTYLNVPPTPPGIGGVSTWSVGYNAKYSQFTIASGNVSVIFRINPMFGLNKGVSQILGAEKAYRRNSTLAEMMGFAYETTAYKPTQVSSFASMLYTSYVDIVSTVLCKNQDVRDTSTNYQTGNNILARLYIAPDLTYAINDDGSNLVGIRPFMLHKEFSIPKEIKWSPDEFLPSCNIRLQDQYGDILYSNPIDPYSYQFTGYAGNGSWVQMNMLISEATN